jgi:hypothetical protein
MYNAIRATAKPAASTPAAIPALTKIRFGFEDSGLSLLVGFIASSWHYVDEVCAAGNRDTQNYPSNSEDEVSLPILLERQFKPV